MPSTLRGAESPLIDLYDVALLDLDGVVYIGPDVVPGAATALASAREAGMRVAFVTNNAARPPHAVADHLEDLGVRARTSEIVTSAQAAARYLAERLPGGARVLVVGTTGLTEALDERGLVAVADADGQVDAVVEGYSPDLTWRQFAEGAIAINRGVLWVATNVDRTIPSPRGPLPGNGAFVEAMRYATGRDPVVTGKPDPAMHRESLLRSEAERPIVVGDRLDTDIEGANTVGCPSLLVLTGVTGARDLLAAGPKLRPTYLAYDLDGLLDTHPQPRVDDGAWTCGRWQARREGDAVLLSASAEARAPRDDLDEAGGAGRRDVRKIDDRIDDDTMDALRAMCAAQWSVHDDDADRGGGVVVRAGDDAAARVIRVLGLVD